MNREIKFRAWFSGIPAMVEFGLGENNIDVYDSIDDKFTVDINNADSIMQYTGLKDRNGKEIYEGDVVKINWSENLHQAILEIPEDETCTVEFEIGQFVFNTGIPCYVHADITETGMPICEVIGNIHENPELL